MKTRKSSFSDLLLPVFKINMIIKRMTMFLFTILYRSYYFQNQKLETDNDIERAIGYRKFRYGVVVNLNLNLKRKL